MAKKKRERGRPTADNPLSERVLVRMDARTKEALGEFARRSGAAADATALRIIAIERLRQEGLLK